MNINTLKKIILDTEERLKGLRIYERDLRVPLDAGSIVTIIGPRRSGKTFYLYHLKNLLSSRSEKALLVSLDDERITPTREELNTIVEAGYQLHGDFGYLLLDEVQETEGWERFVKRISQEKRVYITGSSSRLLSREIATHLRGRTITFELLPLSFREIVRLSGYGIKDTYNTREESAVKGLFEDYMQYGGFPEVFFSSDITSRIKLLESYRDVMLLRDVVERHDVRHVRLLKIMLNTLVNSYSKEFSIRKISDFIKSSGYRHDRNLLYEYAEYLADTFMVFYLPRFSRSIYKREAFPKKVFLIDGFMFFAQDRSETKDLESLVFLELRKIGFREGETLFYHKTQSSECDFLIKEEGRIQQAIQVTYRLGMDNRDRELKGLVRAMEQFRLEKGVVITKDQHEDIVVSSRGMSYRIQVIPAWRWALDRHAV